jgi:hypothetical protein
VRSFADRKIEFAFPTQTLRLNQSAMPGVLPGSAAEAERPTA